MGKMRVQLFGSTTVVLGDGRVVTDLGGIKPRQVLEMLALSLGTPVSKERLADQLWNGEPPRSYIGTLESYVSLIRRRLGVARGRTSAISTTSAGYVLDPALVDVDLDQFRRLVQPTARTAPDSLLARTQQANQLVTGELVASEPYADWAVVERTLFQGEYVQACNRAAASALELDLPEQAVEMARRAIRCDQVSETSWQQLIRALAATGARNEALRAYLDFRRILVAELGTEPGAASRDLYLELLQDDGDATGEPASASEVTVLLRLLRNALESIPGVDLPRGHSSLGEIAALVGAA
ncbi:MAG TPA: BTAD domain-containing putative transcriptional regulator [Nocardioidaceae bacterium]|nr:BTAD domain-containing putative transcriptional regulator [Nocardioidaceae bacterium]